jgi:hypothetical protein
MPCTLSGVAAFPDDLNRESARNALASLPRIERVVGGLLMKSQLNRQVLRLTRSALKALAFAAAGALLIGITGCSAATPAKPAPQILLTSGVYTTCGGVSGRGKTVAFYAWTWRAMMAQTPRRPRPKMLMVGPADLLTSRATRISMTADPAQPERLTAWGLCRVTRPRSELRRTKFCLRKRCHGTADCLEADSGSRLSRPAAYLPRTE